MKSIIGLFFTGILLTTSEALRCYVCTSEGGTSDLCFASPSSVSVTPAVDCNLRYCTIRRQEYLDPPGSMASFHRGCESNPVHLNTMIDSGEFRTYYRACSSDLCNTGNGIQPVSDGSGARSNITTLLVPGTGASSAPTHKAGATSHLWAFILAAAVGVVGVGHQ